MTLYRETPCEHGKIGKHFANAPPELQEMFYDGDWCPGGSREEVTIDYKAAFRHGREVLAALGETFTDEDEQQIRELIDAALHTEKEPASPIKVQP